MTTRTAGQLALKVVSKPTYYEGALGKEEILTKENCHSLHQLCSQPFDINPGLIQPILHNFSRSGDTVLDPNCGSGGVGLEAALLERKAMLATTDPLSLAIARAKVHAADLTEVALWLQLTPLRAPVGCDNFENLFSPFYDIETFREVASLRRMLSRKDDRVAEFVSALALSLLHGKSAASLSVYSPADRALTPEQQREVNFRRHQIPDHRPVAPRLLRKTAMVLQDGLPSALRDSHSLTTIQASEMRDLKGISTGKIDLVICNPTLPRHRVAKNGSWLKHWFLQLPLKTPLNQHVSGLYQSSSWDAAMNESLVEFARCVRPGGRVALFCDKHFDSLNDDGGPSGGSVVKERILRLVEDALSLYWEGECYLSLPEKRMGVTGKTKRSTSFRYRSHPDGVLVLRRK